MKERGILFTPENIGKCADGSKTQTRRIVKPQPPCCCEYVINGNLSHALCRSIKDHNIWVPPTATSKDHRLLCPFGTVGDRLYVKEGLAVDRIGTMRYRRDEQAVLPPEGFTSWPWSKDTLSPLHMPKWAARLWLEITEVRVERLHEISEDDCKAEGVREMNGQCAGIFICEPAYSGTTAKECFRRLWESNNRPGSWGLNPWVWVIAYKKVQT